MNMKSFDTNCHLHISSYLRRYMRLVTTVGTTVSSSVDSELSRRSLGTGGSGDCWPETKETKT